MDRAEQWERLKCFHDMGNKYGPSQTGGTTGAFTTQIRLMLPLLRDAACERPRRGPKRTVNAHAVARQTAPSSFADTDVSTLLFRLALWNRIFDVPSFAPPGEPREARDGAAAEGAGVPVGVSAPAQQPQRGAGSAATQCTNSTQRFVKEPQNCAHLHPHRRQSALRPDGSYVLPRTDRENAWGCRLASGVYPGPQIINL